MQQLLFIYHYYINIHLLIFVYKHAFCFLKRESILYELREIVQKRVEAYP